MDNTVVINDYRQMDKVIKEGRQYLLNICKKIKKANCNVLLIQKSILRDAVDDTREGMYRVSRREEAARVSFRVGIKESRREGTATDPILDTGATRVSATAAGLGICSAPIPDDPIAIIPSGIVSSVDDLRGRRGASKGYRSLVSSMPRMTDSSTPRPPSNRFPIGFGENAWSKPIYASSVGM